MRSLLLFFGLVVSLESVAAIYSLPSQVDSLPSTCSASGSLVTCTTDLELDRNEEIGIDPGAAPLSLTIQGNLRLRERANLNALSSSSEFSLRVDGNLVTDNNIIINGAVSVGGSINGRAKVVITGDVTVTGTLGLGNNAVVNGDIQADTVNLALNATLNGTTNATSVSISKRGNINGPINAVDVSIGERTRVSADINATNVTLINRSIMNGNITAVNVDVNESVEFSGDINASDVDIGRRVQFDGNITGNDVDIGGLTTIDGNINATDTVSNSGTVTGYVNAPTIQGSGDYDGITCDENSNVGPCSGAIIIDHFRLGFDGIGLTCEAKTLLVSACIDTNCNALSDVPATVQLALSGGSSTTVNFTGFETGPTPTSLTRTQVGTGTLSADGPLRCFNGGIEGACDLTFANAGFQFYGADTGSPVAMQTAEAPFVNANLRAVIANEAGNQCLPLLANTTQAIALEVDCAAPNQCLTPFQGIGGNQSGVAGGNLPLSFDGSGVASLSGWQYADAGQLNVSASALISGVTVSSGATSITVAPAQLRVTSENITAPHPTAGLPFTLNIDALGAGGSPLPNYQPGLLQLSLAKSNPLGGGEGRLEYAASNSLLTGNTQTPDLVFSQGRYQYTQSLYSEAGEVTLSVADNNYFGSIIAGPNSQVGLGPFAPAYYDLAFNGAQLGDSCGTFSYLGQTLFFDTVPEFTLTAFNHINEQVFNHDQGVFWTPDPGQLSALSYSDAQYAGTIAPVDLGSVSQGVENGADFDGELTIRLSNLQAVHQKTASSVTPFNSDIAMTLPAGYWTNASGSAPICYQAAYPDGCSDISVNVSAGTSLAMRYGRLAMIDVLGPETRNLRMPLRAEFVDGSGSYVPNTADNCTALDLRQEDGEIGVTAPTDGPDISASLSNLTATGMLLNGQPLSFEGLLIPSSGLRGSATIGLLPVLNQNNHWEQYLNVDWDGDGDIDVDDGPRAKVTFGQYRGNDRVIFWREY